MFDELKRALKRTQNISVSLPSDVDGYYDRECPSPACLFQFKVHEDDWRDKVRDEHVFCPFCGHETTSDKWFTQEQIEHAKSAAAAQIETRIGTAMRRDAEQWNRRQSRKSFLRMTMSVKNSPPLRPLPAAVTEPMRLRIVCHRCSCRYAVIGSAFFCPACGHNAADLMFQQALSGIRGTLDALPTVRAAIADRDIAETTSRHVLENGLLNAVTAFQRYAEALYAKLPDQPKARRNVFQNLSEGSNLWYGATGKSYEDYLSQPALNELVRLFQQRHLLAHTQGVVDQDYLIRSGDPTYRIGQRIVVKESAVRTGITHIATLAAGMVSDSPP